MFKTSMLAASADFVVMADVATADYRILVSCYRGPWNEVIWDHPNPEFIASLEENGYSTEEATEIAEYICRDPRLVYNPEAMVKEVRQVLAEAPRG